MKYDINIIENTLDKLAYETNKAIPEINIIWIPHSTSERKVALSKKIQKIDAHTGGRNIIPSLTSLAQSINETEKMSAISIGKSNQILKKQKAISSFYINIDHITDDFSLKHAAYSDLYILLSILGAPNISLRKLRKTHGTIIDHSLSTKQKITLHAGADCFAAICLSMQGHKNAFTKIAKLRTKQAMEPIKGTTPETFVFSLVFELAQLIYRNYFVRLQNHKDNNKLAFMALFNLAKTVEASLDLNTAKSWGNFAKNTQTLAWQNIKPRKILGAAAYTCEDPFVRSNAYLASEILNMEPALTSYTDFYNPFAEDELNEKNHKKLCLEYFEVIIDKARKNSPYETLKEAALEQNERFLDGNIIGWSAPTLIKLSHYCENNGAEKTLQSAEELFIEFLKETPWHIIQKAGHTVIQAKMKLEPQPFQSILDNFKNNADLKPIAQALSYSKTPTDEKTTP